MPVTSNKQSLAVAVNWCGGTPRVFCAKSVDLLECKGLEFFRDDKEPAIVSKQGTWTFGDEQAGSLKNEVAG
jgi:hypothetical protein